jgi:hypothetical protein
MNSTIVRSLILGGFGAVLVSSMVLAQNRAAPAPAKEAPAAAVAAQNQNNYTCMEFVTWRTSNNASMSPVLSSGINPLEPPMTGTAAGYLANPASAGGVPVSGVTITAAASDCHGKTAATFNANAAFGLPFCTSASCPVCVSQNGRYHEVWAIDRFLEISEPPTSTPWHTPVNPATQRYNKVAGYKVDCNAIVVTQESGLVGGVAPF